MNVLISALIPKNHEIILIMHTLRLRALKEGSANSA